MKTGETKQTRGRVSGSYLASPPVITGSCSSKRYFLPFSASILAFSGPYLALFPVITGSNNSLLFLLSLTPVNNCVQEAGCNTQRFLGHFLSAAGLGCKDGCCVHLGLISMVLFLIIFSHQRLGVHRPLHRKDRKRPRGK